MERDVEIKDCENNVAKLNLINWKNIQIHDRDDE